MAVDRLKSVTSTMPAFIPRRPTGDFNVGGVAIVVQNYDSADAAARHFARIEDPSVRAVALADDRDTAPMTDALETLCPGRDIFHGHIILSDKDDYAESLPEIIQDYWRTIHGHNAARRIAPGYDNREAFAAAAAAPLPDLWPLIEDLQRNIPLVMQNMPADMHGLQISFLKLGRDNYVPHNHPHLKHLAIRNFSDAGTLISLANEPDDMHACNSLQVGKGITMMTGTTIHSTPDAPPRWIYNISKPLF